jgi:type I restriction enzyme S subunit
MSELPGTWIKVPISQVAEVNPRKSVDLSGDDPVSFVPMAAVDEVSGTIASPIDRPYNEVSKGFTHFRDEDVIFAKITPSMENGKSAVARDLTNGTGMGSTEFHVFRSYGAIEPEYLWRHVRQQSFRDEAQSVMSGAVGQQRVPADWLKEHVIPLAPMAEQRRIVEKVDSLTASTARARKELDRIPSLIARYKQRLLALAFRGEMTSGWRSINEDAQPVIGRGATEIRSKFSSKEKDEFVPPYPIPPTWRWLRLPEIGELDRGKSRHRPRNDPRLFGGPYPFVQTGDVRAADKLLTEFDTTYSEFGLQQSRLWPVGTVCITIAANIAETAILGIEACFPDSVVGFLPDLDRLSGDYVEFFIRTMRSELEAFAPATAQKNINLSVLSSVRVPVPPAEEQIEIVRRIESAFGWLDRLGHEHASASRLLPKLEGAILAKAFRGELVPQNPNDEPAGALLERIAEARATSKRVSTRSPRKKTTQPRTPRKAKVPVTKSRRDDDVWQKPYLAEKLKELRASDVQSLFHAADLPVDEFYKQLAWEVAEKHIIDDPTELKAA